MPRLVGIIQYWIGLGRKWQEMPKCQGLLLVRFSIGLGFEVNEKENFRSTISCSGAKIGIACFNRQFYDVDPDLCPIDEINFKVSQFPRSRAFLVRILIDIRRLSTEGNDAFRRSQVRSGQVRSGQVRSVQGQPPDVSRGSIRDRIRNAPPVVPVR